MELSHPLDAYWLGDVLAAAQEEGEEVVEEAEEDDPPNPVLPVGNEILWAAIFFALLWALMRYVLLPPIKRLQQEREEKLRGDRDSADRTADEVARARAEHEAALAGARAEANRLIDEARAAADARKAELQAAADAELAELRRATQEEIDRARETALRQLEGQVGDLAVTAASLVIQKDLDPAAQQSIIQRALNGS